MVSTLKFNDNEKQFMVDVVHFFGRTEISRKELREYRANFGLNSSPAFITKNTACKSATRGTYIIPVNRLHLMTSLEPSVEAKAMAAKRTEMTKDGETAPVVVIEGATKTKREKAPTTTETKKTVTKKAATKKTKKTVVATTPDEEVDPTMPVPTVTKKSRSKADIKAKIEKMRQAKEQEEVTAAAAGETQTIAMTEYSDEPTDDLQDEEV
jgi:hypothetical protein